MQTTSSIWLYPSAVVTRGEAVLVKVHSLVDSSRFPLQLVNLMEVVHSLGAEACLDVLLRHGPVVAAWIGDLTCLGVLKDQDR